jgi:hypothetical protein
MLRVESVVRRVLVPDTWPVRRREKPALQALDFSGSAPQAVHATTGLTHIGD